MTGFRIFVDLLADDEAFAKERVIGGEFHLVQSVPSLSFGLRANNMRLIHIPTPCVVEECGIN